MVPPSINFKYSDVNKMSFDYLLIKDLIKSYPNRKLVFQDGSNPGVLNSFYVKLNPILEKENIRNGIILDKILINLDKIASNANQIDEVFFDILYERMNEVFSFFKNKENLVKKKLNQENSWNSILKDLIKHDEGKWQENAHKSVSFYGLNNAVQQHCGIDLDRLESSENFALNIMSFMQKLIEKENSENNETYLLSQPHIDDIDSRNPEPTRLIRENSGLSLNRQIKLFKKFQAIMKGGSIFSFKLNDETSTLLKIFEIIKEIKVEAFCFY